MGGCESRIVERFQDRGCGEMTRSTNPTSVTRKMGCGGKPVEFGDVFHDSSRSAIDGNPDHGPFCFLGLYLNLETSTSADETDKLIAPSQHQYYQYQYHISQWQCLLPS